MEVNQLIAEIARTTGARLDRSDPILAVAAINEVLLDQALVKLDRQVKVQADRVTAASTQAVLDAKKEAEALLTDAAEWIDARMKAAGAAVAEQVVTDIQQELQTVRQARRSMLRLAWIVMVVGLVALSGAGGIALAALR